MAFVAASAESGKNAPTFGQMYRHGVKTQSQFQCGWNTSYLKTSAQKPLSFENFGHVQHMDASLRLRQPIKQVPSHSVRKVPVPSQLDQQSVGAFFMAGRKGCGYVGRAVQQHSLQNKTVAELDCVGDDKNHPVCQIQVKHRRGTPMYYKQTGPESYELVHTGFTEDLSFLP
jgi:hypothetical protein